MRNYRRWTAEEDARLLHLHDVKGWFFNAIDVELGRVNKASSDRYKRLMGQRGNVPRQPRTKTSRTVLRDAIRADDIARASAGHTSITAMLLGDPPPGRSALDQKRMISP